MKYLFHFVLYLSLGLIASLPALAQITITASDVGAYLAPGSSSTSKTDSSTHSLNIGSLGSSSWDFSGLVRFLTATTPAIRPDTTPYFSLFPTATHGLSTGGFYAYYKLSTNLEFLGVAQGGATPIRLKEIPPQILDQLPMTNGTNWTSSYTESTYVTIAGTTYPSATNSTVNYTVDAYGNMTIPGGTSHQVLRLKIDRHTTSNGHTNRSIVYEFLSKDGTSVTVVPSDTNQPQTGTISVLSSSWSVPTNTLGVEPLPGVAKPSTFTLEQNYPNPFNPKTDFGFGISDFGWVTVKIYDVLGREVATVVDETKQPGHYRVSWDASGFTSGVYFYELRSGGVSERKKMILLR